MLPLHKAICRGLLREARALTRSGTSLRFTDPPSFEALVKAHGTGAFIHPPTPAALQSLIFPGAPFAAAGLSHAKELRGCDIAPLLRACFRHPGAAQTLDAGLRHLAALNSLRALSPQRSFFRTTLPGRVCVEVEVCALGLFAAPAEVAEAAGHYRFAYRVRLRNAGDVYVRLLSRHLVFTDARQGSIVVPKESPGVVGESPGLPQGSCFQYVSSVALSTPSGVMRGSYGLITETGEFFDADLGVVELRPFRV